MALITLQQMYDAWKRVADWVSGANTDKPPVRVTDGTDTLAINPDGSLPVQLTGSNVPDAQAIPAKIMSTYDQTRIVKLSTDTIVAAGANYDWNITGTDYNQLRKFPFFAVVLSWKVGSSNLNWDFSVWQYMTYSEGFSNIIPDSIAAIDSLPSSSTSRTHAGRFRNLGNNSILVRVRNKSSQDQILTNLYVVGLDAI